MRHAPAGPALSIHLESSTLHYGMQSLSKSNRSSRSILSSADPMLQSQAMSVATGLASPSFLRYRSSPIAPLLPAVAPSLSSPGVCTKSAAVVTCCASSPSSSSLSTSAVVNGGLERRTASERSQIRVGLPSKGRMAADTLELLKVLPFDGTD